MNKLYLALALFMSSTAAIAGAWGVGSFDNDGALDWIDQCLESRDTAAIVLALNTSLKAKMIEEPDGAAAIAAAEVVAASMGKPGKDFPDSLRAWLQLQSKEKIAKLGPSARKALERIRDPKLSELKQLWSQSNSKQWDERLVKLQSRLAN